MTKRLAICLPVALASTILLAGCGGGSMLDISDVRAVAPNAEISDYQAGKLHFGEGRIGLALKSFREAMRQDPTSVPTLNGLAASYDRIQRFDLAQVYYDKALAIEPGSAQTLNNIGYSMLLRGDRTEALAYFDKAKTIDPLNMVVAANMARLAPAAVAGQETDRLTVLASAVADQPRAWIERKSERVQYLVTTPDISVVAQAERDGVEPNLIAYSPVRAVEAEDAEIGDRPTSPAARVAARGDDKAEEQAGPTAFPVSMLRYLISLMGIDFGQPGTEPPANDVAATAIGKAPA
jgi:tetratricopeptide (TPR) repeat protein